METNTTVGGTASAVISHYTGDGSTPIWTSNPMTGSWTRQVEGIGGSLAAIQTNGQTPTLQIANLHGDVIGTIPDTAEGTVTLTSEPTAFGAPTTSAPAVHSWLGLGGLETELPSGIARSGNSSYIPQLGMYLGAQEISPAVAQDPVNEYLGNEKEAEVIGTRVVEGPNAIEPVTYNQRQMEEFWAQPPWDKPPSNEIQWEGTIGDPVGCNVSAFEPVQQGEVFGHQLEGWGSFVCAGPVSDVTFEVCLQEELRPKQWLTAKCHPVTYRDAESGELSVEVSCKVGSTYRTTAWLTQGLEAGIRQRSKSAVCEPDEFEESFLL